MDTLSSVRFKVPPEGAREAMRLTFICFVKQVSVVQLSALSNVELASFFGDHGMSFDEVEKAYTYLAAYFAALEEAVADCNKPN